MKWNLAACCIASVALLCVATAKPFASLATVVLAPKTAADFDAFVKKTDLQNSASPSSNESLWVDSLNPAERVAAYGKLRAGEVVMRRVPVPSDDHNIPGGMIHDWQGIVFIPGATLNDALRILQDYDHQSIYYAPDVAASKLLEHQGNRFRFFLRFRRKKIVTVVLDTQHQVEYFSDSATRSHSRSSATRIAEVQDPGTPNEKELMPGSDNGFLWRMETWWRLEQKDGGVYVQNQVVSLTRDIPTGLGWLIEPFVTAIPKESLEFTLTATRTAVLQIPK